MEIACSRRTRPVSVRFSSFRYFSASVRPDPPRDVASAQATRGAAHAARHTRRGLQYRATAASRTSRTDPGGCPPSSRGLHRLAAEAVALRRRLPALSTEQARGGTALHQSQEVRTSQRKHQMLPQHTQLCAAQRTGHATQSRPSVCPRGCRRKAWQACTRLLRGHALRPGERGAGTQPFLESCVPEGRFFCL